MKIELRIICQQDAIAALARDPEIAAAVDLDAIAFELDAEEEMFDRVLDRTRGTSGCWLNPIMNFTRTELKQARYYQLDCRKTVRESDDDSMLNLSTLKDLPFVRTDAAKIKLLDRLALSRIQIKPNMVAGVGDWTAEFIIGTAVAAAFDQAGLTGYELREILNPKTDTAYDDFFQLYSSEIMPAAERDSTVLPPDPSQGTGFRQLGCLTYRFSADPAADFQRTAEDWSSNHMPFWVVSERVRQTFEEHKLRGWSFRPVLEPGTGLHDVYQTKWDHLLQRMAVNPSNRF